MMEKVAKLQPSTAGTPDAQNDSTRRVEARVELPLQAVSKKVAGVCGLIMHSSSSKKDWSIYPMQDVRVLVIGDSNLRDVISVPPLWEVHVLHGARIGHVIGACSRLSLDKPSNLETVVFQVGVNHREDTNPPVQHLKILARKFKAVGVRTAFVGVSYDSKLPGRQRIQLNELNLAAKDSFDIYVPPLHPREVMIRRGDRYGIHYDTDTVCRIMASIVEANLLVIQRSSMDEYMSSVARQ